MVTCESPAHGAITRRLSPCSFETSDVDQCATWLRAIGYVDLPHRGSEYARLRIGEDGTGGTCVIFTSGLVICVGGRP